MQQFVGRARILLLASHSADLCRSMCNRALVLSKGEAVFFGDVEEGFKVYAGHLGRAKGREDGTPPNNWNEQLCCWLSWIAAATQHYRGA